MKKKALISIVMVLVVVMVFASVSMALTTVKLTGITLDKTAVTLGAGMTQTLAATITPANATSKTLTWTSSDSKIATVSSKGAVKAVKAGKATITAKSADGKVTAKCTVTVIAALKKVTLNFVMVGDAAKEVGRIEDKLNALSTKDLNCTVKYTYTTWTDFSNKYNLILTSGQPVDLIYVANWLTYYQYAKNGAFKPLDSLLPTYAPDIYKAVSTTDWNSMKVNGKIYAMPNIVLPMCNLGVGYRKDLADKYKLPAPTTVANVEKYLDGIMKNNPGVTPTVFCPNGTTFAADTILPVVKYAWGPSLNQTMDGYGLVYNVNGDMSKLTNYWASSDFVTDMKLYRSWEEKGYWSKSALSDKPDLDAVKNGTAFLWSSGYNVDKFIGDKKTVMAAHPDWVLDWVDQGDVSKVSLVSHPSQNGFAVPAVSKNPERALMFYDKLMFDKNYYMLSQYGELNKDYKVDSNGMYVGLGDQTNPKFGQEGMLGWAWRNPLYTLKNPNADLYAPYLNKMNARKTENRPYGFMEDNSSYTAEVAQLTNVMTQYLVPLEAGMIPDVDKGIADFRQKAKEAGLDKIQASVTEQWKKFCAEYIK